MAWNMRKAKVDSDRQDQLLAAGWEPFAVDHGWMFFRKPTPPDAEMTVTR